VYQELSQFARLDTFDDYGGAGEGGFSVWVDSSARSPSAEGVDSHQMWTPRFSFRSSTLSVLSRYYRRFKRVVFGPKSLSTAQTLPSRETPGALSRWLSYYWHRLVSKKAKELD